MSVGSCSGFIRMAKDVTYNSVSHLAVSFSNHMALALKLWRQEWRKGEEKPFRFKEM